MSAWLWAIVAATLLVWLAARRGLWTKLVATVVERRLGGYRHLVEPVDSSLPARLADRGVRVAVVGGGLGGVGGAAAVGGRGGPS